MKSPHVLAGFAMTLALAATGAHAAGDLVMRDSFDPIDCAARPDSPACPIVIAATPAIELSPGESDVYCYYFRSANEVPVQFARTQAEVRGVVTKAELFATHSLLGVPVERLPPSSVSTLACGLLVALDGSVATLLATLRLDGVLSVVDDALGGIPTTIEPNQPMFLKITMSNTTDRMASGGVRWIAPRGAN